jgi:cytochrome c-type biogenesis protein CcmE
MKKIHIALLVLIAAAIGILISSLNTGSTYGSIAEAKTKPGKFLHVAVQLDKSIPVEFDPIKNSNYMSFQAKDSTGEKMKVIYRKGEIPNLMISDRLVLKGTFKDDHFECKDVQTKCPSKYKEDPKAASNNAMHNAATGAAY